MMAVEKVREIIVLIFVCLVCKLLVVTQCRRKCIIIIIIIIIIEKFGRRHRL